MTAVLSMQVLVNFEIFTLTLYISAVCKLMELHEEHQGRKISNCQSCCYHLHKAVLHAT